MASTYEVRRSDIAGEGTFATRRIRRGQRIMSCRPLVMNRAFRSVPTSQTIREILSWEHDSTKAFKEAEFRKVTANAQCIEKVRSISNRVDQLFEDCSILTNEEDMRPPTERDLETVLCQVHDVERSPDMQLRVAKFLCNRLFLDGNTFNGNGLFEELWKVNHSCRPNAVATWNEETQRMNLHALRTIRPDKEIFISYMPWDLLDFDQRSRWLYSHYFFDCECKYCCDPRAAKSAQKRQTLLSLQADCDARRKNRPRNPVKNVPVPKEDLKAFEEYHRLYELHIGKDAYIAHSYVDKALFLVHYSRTIDAWESLHVSYEIFSTCYGIDHPFTKAKFIMLQNIAGRLQEPKMMVHLIDCLSGEYMAAEIDQAPISFVEQNEEQRFWIETRTDAVKKTIVHDYPWHGLLPG